MAEASGGRAGQHDIRIMSLVAAAHFCSHLLALALPPLFPILRDEFGVGFTELGLAVTGFYVASGFGQAYAGVLVDRYGAPRLLLAGLITLSLGVGLAGLATSYWMLLPLAAVAGLGNSIFHPADLSIISRRVSEGRLGRAFALHGILGQLGFAASPLLILFAAGGHWRIALGCFSLVGLTVAATIFANRHVLEYARAEAVAGPAQRPSYLAAINSPVVLLAFSYFILTAFAGAGIQTFGVVAWTAGYGLSAEIAALALSAYLFGVAGGMIGGGVLADRTTQHHRVAMAGMTIACTAVVATLPFGGLPWLVVTAMAVAGLASGTTSPSRDMLIRQAASKSGMGKVFGFVYSGFDLGLSVGPLLFGILVDHHAPRAVFMAVAAAFAVAAPTVMRVRQRAAT